MNLLLALTLTGTCVSGVAILLDLLLARFVTGGVRRVCLLIATLAFLLPFRAGLLPWPPAGAATAVVTLPQPPDFHPLPLPSFDTFSRSAKWAMVATAAWVLGVGLHLAWAIGQTVRVKRGWARVRLSTDPVLLGLLEDCKVQSAVTIPLGLVVTDAVASPAILGWLRPRLLLPADLASSMSRENLQCVFLHELAHVKAVDIATNWLFVVVGALHWFNPAALLAGRYFRRFAEEAADETAMRWANDSDGLRYGHALLAAVRPGAGANTPYGVFALGETFSNLKHRITMIRYNRQKRPRRLLGCLVATGLLCLMLVRPAYAADDPVVAKKDAGAAMTPWLSELDSGAYDQSWTEASAKFQSLVGQSVWREKISAARAPLGKCTQRTLLSALYNPPTTSMPQGYVLAQFRTSFENLALAIETVTFMKEGDHWKAIGYYVKPSA